MSGAEYALGDEHVVLVAMVYTAATRADAERFAQDSLVYARVPEWWIAEDDRTDGSDCDSAVFCTPGRQVEARDLLREHGLVH